MCRPLQVHCGCSESTHRDNRTTHSLTMPRFIVPCQVPGSAACKAGQGRSVKFQNPTTECAGVNEGFHPAEKEAQKLCEAALEKYGAEVYRANSKDFNRVKKTAPGWFFGWF